MGGVCSGAGFAVQTLSCLMLDISCIFMRSALCLDKGNTIDPWRFRDQFAIINFFSQCRYCFCGCIRCSLTEQWVRFKAPGNMRSKSLWYWRCHWISIYQRSVSYTVYPYCNLITNKKMTKKCTLCLRKAPKWDKTRVCVLLIPSSYLEEKGYTDQQSMAMQKSCTYHIQLNKINSI